jgi:hypothetical protein
MVSTDSEQVMSNVDRDAALQIARADAATVYRSLDAYVEHAELLDNDVWKIDFELRDVGAQGGGPHYLISANTGEIIERRYEQ